MNKDEKISELKNLWMDGFSVCSITVAREILHNYPDELSVLIVLGNALTAVDRFDDAIEVIEKAIQVATQDQTYHAFVTMAFACYEKGAFKEAENWYKKAFDQHTPRPVDQVFYSECLIKRGEYSEVIELLGKSVDANATAHYTLGVAYRAIEKYDDALECFQKAVSLDKDYEVANEAIIDILKMKEFIGA